MALAQESRILHSEMAMLLDVDVAVTERLVARGLSMIFLSFAIQCTHNSIFTCPVKYVTETSRFSKPIIFTMRRSNRP